MLECRDEFLALPMDVTEFIRPRIALWEEECRLFDDSDMHTRLELGSAEHFVI